MLLDSMVAQDLLELKANQAHQDFRAALAAQALLGPSADPGLLDNQVPQDSLAALALWDL